MMTMQSLVLDGVLFAVEDATERVKSRLELAKTGGYDKTELEILRRYREDLSRALSELSDVIGELS